MEEDLIDTLQSAAEKVSKLTKDPNSALIVVQKELLRWFTLLKNSKVANLISVFIGVQATTVGCI